MGEIFLNIYIVQPQLLIRRDFDETLKIAGLMKELKAELEDDIIVVGGNRIPLADDSDCESVWRSLWDFTLEQFSRPKRTQTLREMFPDYVENELHFIVTSSRVRQILVYLPDQKPPVYIEETNLLIPLCHLVSKKFSEEEVANLQFIKPVQPIYDDGKTDIAAAVNDAVHSLAISVNAPTLENLRLYYYHANLLDVLPWGGYVSYISLIVWIPGCETENISTDLPISRRQRYFQRYRREVHSSEGWPEKFRAAQMDDERVIHCGRGVENAVPASLLDENLCKFQHNLRTCTPTAEDIRLFRVIRATLIDIFPSEADRMKKLIAVMGRIVPQPGVMGNFATGGDIRATCQDIEFMLYTQGITNEVASTPFEPYFQGIHHWLASIDSCLPKLTDAQKLKINFPALILTHFGPYITIAAAAFGDSPNVEPLVTLSLHVHSSNAEALAEGERMVCALRVCLRDLFRYYSNFVTDDSCQSGFPFRDYYLSGEVRKYFVYDKRFVGKRFFFARSKEAPDTRFCIKFSRRYSEAAHRAAVALDIAPHLYAVDTFYGWYMIVMEDLSADYVTLDSLRVHGMAGQVGEALSKLHDVGFVHGDVRDLNVLVRRPSAPRTLPEFQIVDFDWAGAVDQATYPHCMNPEVRRAKDAVVGGKITPAHDLFMSSLL